MGLGLSQLVSGRLPKSLSKVPLGWKHLDGPWHEHTMGGIRTSSTSLWLLCGNDLRGEQNRGDMWRPLLSFKEGIMVVSDIEHHRCRDEAR